MLRRCTWISTLNHKVEQALNYKKTSIIVVTYKAIDYLKRCVESIQEYTHVPYELIMIDNHSDDDVPQYLKSVKGITLILNNDNRLLTPAQTQGLQRLSEDVEYVLFLNPDIEIIKEGWLTRMIDLLESKSHIGIVGPICNYHPMGPLKGCIDMSCLLVRRNVLEECGGLDENYPWNGAGLVLAAAAWTKGWRYKHLPRPKIVVHHKAKSRSYHHIPNYYINQKKVFIMFGLAPHWSLLGLLRQIWYRPETLWQMVKEKFSSI